MSPRELEDIVVIGLLALFALGILLPLIIGRRTKSDDPNSS